MDHAGTGPGTGVNGKPVLLLTFFTGTGRHRVQIIYFLWMQIGSQTPSGVGLMSGSRLYRIRHRCGGLVLSEGPGSKPWPIIAKNAWAAERIRLKMLEAAARAV